VAEPFGALATREVFAPARDPLEQWLQWEEQANLIGFRTSTAPVAIEVASVPRGELEVEAARGAPAGILSRFLRGDRVLFPRHPLNRDASVSFFCEPVAERWVGRFTSSRTLAIPPAPGAPLLSLKLATDHPHPDFLQPEKTQVRKEALDSLAWVALLDRVEGLLGPEPQLLVVREALAVLVPGTEHGYIVRDLREIQDGHHYLPALSIPWVGRELAHRSREPFAAFWGRHYAEAVGRAKARLFARSGLQYGTPNPQNVLVQLDGDLRPTGRIALRDLGDADCATDARAAGDGPWRALLQDLRPETRNSFWAFGEAGDRSVEAGVLEDWYARHDRAYFAVLAEYFPALAPPGAGPEGGRALAHWNEALRDPRAAGAIAPGFARRSGRRAAAASQSRA